MRMTVTLSLVVDEYHCEDCVKTKGTVVRELVRMMPRAAIMNGELVGTEWWCCPVCFGKKFEVGKKARAKGKSSGGKSRKAG